MADIAPVLSDLLTESNELDVIVTELPPGGWKAPTPASGWTIAHQIAHLAWTDRRALAAVTDPAAFAEDVEAALKAPDTFVDDGAREGSAQEPARLLEQWREGRRDLAAALGAA